MEDLIFVPPLLSHSSFIHDSFRIIPFSQCEEGWRAYEDKCYYFSTDRKSWDDARTDYCTSRGADLVSIHNMEEENFLSTHTKGKSKWIGLQHNPIDGGYHWSDATPVSHTNWGHGEPNNHEGREDCVEMVNFQTAMSRCYDEKAQLVSILNKDEQAYINTMV
uniref:C-type lectin domain-containing protein n=1 Tax=Salmo trutta TaxID=8032 RepID=A0A673Y4C8_SALTR